MQRLALPRIARPSTAPLHPVRSFGRTVRTTAAVTTQPGTTLNFGSSKIIEPAKLRQMCSLSRLDCAGTSQSSGKDVYRQNNFTEYNKRLGPHSRPTLARRRNRCHSHASSLVPVFECTGSVQRLKGAARASSRDNLQFKFVFPAFNPTSIRGAAIQV